MNLKQKIFWIFQVVFWLVYFLYNIFIVHYTSFIRPESSASILVLYLFFLCFFGIPLTLFARMIYDKILSKTRTIVILILAMLVVSVLLARLWTFEIFFLDSVFNEVMADAGVDAETFIPLKSRSVLRETFIATLLLFTWSSIYLFMVFWQEWKTQQFEIEKANLLLENARLRMLRNQVSPHFLFNALSSLRALIREDGVRAERMLSGISDFLRYSLRKKTLSEVPLREEFDAMENYLAIEKVRFEDKLDIEVQIDDRAAEFPVPGFILHPVIENAIKYGMADSPATGPLPLKISLKARMEGNELIVTVANSGTWKEQGDGSESTGTGLSNVRERLETLYPGRHRFVIDKGADRVEVILAIRKP